MSRKERIYVIEDDPDLADIINESLTQKGYHVFLNLGNFVQFSDIIAFEPDLILVDWMLPNIQGVDIIKRIKSNPKTSHILCVLITGRDTEADKIVGYGIGVDAYVTKPFSMDMLMAVISNMEKRMQAGTTSATTGTAAQKDASSERFYRHFVSLVEEHYGDAALDLGEIASQMECSKSTLIKRMNKIANITPYEYLKNYRMKQAKALLLTQNMNVTEVAEKVGYSNLAVFSKAFKSTFGSSPKLFVSNTNQA